MGFASHAASQLRKGWQDLFHAGLAPVFEACGGSDVQCPDSRPGDVPNYAVRVAEWPQGWLFSGTVDDFGGGSSFGSGGVENWWVVAVFRLS